AAPRDHPGLARAPDLPPADLDPPPPDHVADLVSPAAPHERRRHPPVALHRHQVLVELAHRHSPASRPPAVGPHPQLLYSNVCSIWEKDCTPAHRHVSRGTRRLESGFC